MAAVSSFNPLPQNAATDSPKTEEFNKALLSQNMPGRHSPPASHLRSATSLHPPGSQGSQRGQPVISMPYTMSPYESPSHSISQMPYISTALLPTSPTLWGRFKAHVNETPGQHYEGVFTRIQNSAQYKLVLKLAGDSTGADGVSTKLLPDIITHNIDVGKIADTVLKNKKSNAYPDDPYAAILKGETDDGVSLLKKQTYDAIKSYLESPDGAAGFFKNGTQVNEAIQTYLHRTNINANGDEASTLPQQPVPDLPSSLTRTQTIDGNHQYSVIHVQDTDREQPLVVPVEGGGVNSSSLAHPESTGSSGVSTPGRDQPQSTGDGNQDQSTGNGNQNPNTSAGDTNGTVDSSKLLNYTHGQWKQNRTQHVVKNRGKYSAGIVTLATTFAMLGIALNKSEGAAEDAGKREEAAKRDRKRIAEENTDLKNKNDKLQGEKNSAEKEARDKQREVTEAKQEAEALKQRLKELIEGRNPPVPRPPGGGGGGIDPDKPIG